jgi:hypothetical protein
VASAVHTFSSLPLIDEVQIVDLSRIVPKRVELYMDAAAEAPHVTVADRRALDIAELWRALQIGQQDRCHVPPFGLRFFRQHALLLSASICWQCNNVFGSDQHGLIHAEFDAAHTSARDLFLRLSAAVTSWDTYTRPDGTAHPQLIISEAADWSLFESTAEKLRRGLGGRWTEKLDGPDERYWDLQARGGRITLHLQHYLGISLYPSDAERADVASLALLKDAHRILSDPGPG